MSRCHFLVPSERTRSTGGLAERHALIVESTADIDGGSWPKRPCTGDVDDNTGNRLQVPADVLKGTACL
jgi:hypothetical protein